MSGTLRDLVNAAGRTAGIIAQNAVLSGENLNVCLYALNNLIDTYSNNKLLVYSVTPYVFPLTGQKEYTLGLGGDWNIPRPMKIEKAFARLQPGSAQQLDIGMQSLTPAQYAAISVKNTPSTFPFAFYDDNKYPLRTVSLFPIPSGPASIVLWLREPLIDLRIKAIEAFGPITGGTGYIDGYYENVRLGHGSGTGAMANIEVTNSQISKVILVNAGTDYAINDVLQVSPSQVGGTGSGFSIQVLAVSGNLDTPIDFPPGYERFLRLHLAIEIAAEFGKKIREDVVGLAKQSRDELETLNSTPVYVRGDGAMNSGRNRYFNWITGNLIPFGNNN